MRPLFITLSSRACSRAKYTCMQLPPYTLQYAHFIPTFQKATLHHYTYVSPQHFMGLEREASCAYPSQLERSMYSTPTCFALLQVDEMVMAKNAQGHHLPVASARTGNSHFFGALCSHLAENDTLEKVRQPHGGRRLYQSVVILYEMTWLWTEPLTRTCWHCCVLLVRLLVLRYC